jgi:NAD(P)-dependent dehydrogenase (short-subunit alcohol dehydrogenase family)
MTKPGPRGGAGCVPVGTTCVEKCGGLDLSDTQYERRRYSGIGAYRASKQAARMLTWALADQLENEPISANALNPGYVLTNLTTNVSGLLKVLVVLTSFKAQSPLVGADTAIWLAASPEIEGRTGRFWSKRREIPCKFRNPEDIQRLCAQIDQQLTRVAPARVPCATEASRGALGVNRGA